MVSRFADFAKDDEAADIDGIDDDDLDDEDDSSAASSSGEDKDGSFDEAEFERAMQEMMGMPAADIEKSGLLDEARKLALEDAEEGNGEDEMDEDEETRKVMELMEKELKGHGALKAWSTRSKLQPKKRQTKRLGPATVNYRRTTKKTMTLIYCWRRTCLKRFRGKLANPVLLET
jgi:hypothetical protein